MKNSKRQNLKRQSKREKPEPHEEHQPVKEKDFDRIVETILRAKPPRKEEK